MVISADCNFNRTKRQRIRLSRVDATGPTGRWGGCAPLWGCLSAVLGWREPARRRPQASVDGRGFQVRRWSNSKAGAGWSSGSAAGSCSASVASHSGGPWARASPCCMRINGGIVRPLTGNFGGDLDRQEMADVSRRQLGWNRQSNPGTRAPSGIAKSTLWSMHRRSTSAGRVWLSTRTFNAPIRHDGEVPRRLRDLVHSQVMRNAANGQPSRRWLDPIRFKQFGSTRMIDDRTGRQDRA